MKTPSLSSTLRAGLASVTFATALLGASHDAQASGSPERLIQVVTHPTDPSVIVLRYGFTPRSEGFLFSRDGGKTFSAMCSEAIAPTLQAPNRITSLGGGNFVRSAAPVLIDGKGRLLTAQLNGLWSDDATGCTWTKDTQIAENWPWSIKRDPKNPDELWASITVRGDEAKKTLDLAVLHHRDASGKWAAVGPFLTPARGASTVASDLLTAATPTGTRIYAAVDVWATPDAVTAERSVHVSDDGGKTWRKGPPIAADITLLAVDPQNPDRIVAAVQRQDAQDSLVLSEDQGKTFKKYGEPREVTGVAFTPDGRFYVGDGGDETSAAQVGGLWGAPALGKPLAKVEGTTRIDCIGFDAKTQYLHVCMRDRFGLMDPTNGAFQQLTRIEKVASLQKCPNMDTAKVCEGQLNMGISWCCEGHYPFTPFCGDYDVRSSQGKTVYCGKAGRELDLSAGRGPVPDEPGVVLDAGAPMSLPDGGVSDESDAGTKLDGGAPRADGGSKRPDAGKVDAGKRDAGASDEGDEGDEPSAGDDEQGEQDDQDEQDDQSGKGDESPTELSGGKSGGCSLAPGQSAGSPGGALASLGMLLVVLGRSLRRRAKR